MKTLAIALALVCVIAAGIAMGASVVTSKHDLRAVGGGTPTGTGLVQVCVTCHTPHQATTANAQDPLWNHTASANGLYGVYGSSTLNAVPTNFGGTTPNTVGTLNTSQLCMSCHDGTVSVLSMYKAPVLGGSPTVAAVASRIDAAGLIISSANVGTNLSDDHPVNFTYDAALATADGGLVSPTSASQVVAGIPLYSGTVQCASCHNVHDPANIPFLRISNSASALCLSCHVK